MRLPGIGFECWHGSLLNDVGESRRLEVLLSWLLLRIVFTGVLLYALQLVLLLIIVVRVGIEELSTLLSHVKHVLRRRAVRA